MLKPILLALALPLASGCAGLAAGAAAGLVVGQEVIDNDTYVSRVNRDVREVWPAVKTTVSDLSTELISVDENLRTAKGKIHGATVQVAVEAYDIDRSILRVHAEKFGLNDGETAGDVMEKLLAKLEQ